MTFDPKINQTDFNSFWITDAAWGKIRITGSSVDLEVLHGNLELAQLVLPDSYGFISVEQTSHGKAELSREENRLRILLSDLPELQAGQILNLEFRQ